MLYAMCRVPTGITFWDSKDRFKISILEIFDAVFFLKENWPFHLPEFQLLTTDRWCIKTMHSIKVTTWSCLPDLLTFPCFVRDFLCLPWSESIPYIWRSMMCSHPTRDYERKTRHVNTKSLHVLNAAWINVGRQLTPHHQRRGSI